MNDLAKITSASIGLSSVVLDLLYTVLDLLDGQILIIIQLQASKCSFTQVMVPKGLVDLQKIAKFLSVLSKNFQIQILF